MHRDLSWKELVQRSWGKDYTELDVAYEFTNRIFYDARRPHQGDGIPDANHPSVYADNFADDYC